MDRRAYTLGFLLSLLLAGAGLLPPIAQPQAYHCFADQSTCLGVAHCYDTLSNFLFIPAGLAGLIFLGGGTARNSFIVACEKTPYVLFFLSIMVVGLASSYYHLAPDNSRLVWDRAAIAAAMMSWFTAILGERVGVFWGRRLLPVLVLAGLASAGYWGWSETVGRGDLRAYGLMQLVPMLFIPLLLWMYPPHYSGDRDVLVVLALYLLALLCDWLDRPIADLTGMVSGHTLKHVLAASASGWVVIGLRRRRAFAGDTDCRPCSG